MVNIASLSTTVGFALAAVVAGAEPVIGRDDLWGCVEVRQDAGELHFRFQQAQGPNGPFVPSRSSYLSVQGPTGSPIFWLIQAPDETTVEEIIYGVVPKEFEQIIPRIGQPPRLVPDRKYGVSARTPDIAIATFKYGEPGVVGCPRVPG